MRGSPCVRLDAGLETRVTLLLEEYRHFLADRAALDAQLDCLVALHGRERIAEWKALAARGAWPELVSRLLLEHYDPAYKRSSHRNFARLADAPEVRIASAEEAAFDAASGALLRKEAVAA
jgi:tRNA 2-selenouridine synthase